MSDEHDPHQHGDKRHGEMIEQPLFTTPARWRRALPNARQREIGLRRIREIRDWMSRSDRATPDDDRQDRS